jgi:hypothetical protein
MDSQMIKSALEAAKAARILVGEGGEEKSDEF